MQSEFAFKLLDLSAVGWGLLAVLIFTGYMGAVALFQRRGTVRERLRRMMPAEEAPIQDPDKLSDFATVGIQALDTLGIDLDAIRREMQLPMARGGLYTPNQITYYLLFRHIGQPLLLGGAIIFFLLLLTSGGDTGRAQKLLYIMLALIGFIGGFWGARIYLANRTQRRQRILEESFPDALDLLLVCIESGMALDGALARVCRELGKVHPTLTEELDRTRIELTLLGDRIQALKNLADRTNTLSFKSLVTALIQSEQFGTSLADTLRVLAEDYRTTRLMTAENKAAKIPALITVPLIFFILPAFFLIIMGPPILQVMEKGNMFGAAMRQAASGKAPK